MSVAEAVHRLVPFFVLFLEISISILTCSIADVTLLPF